MKKKDIEKEMVRQLICVAFMLLGTTVFLFIAAIGISVLFFGLTVEIDCPLFTEHHCTSSFSI